MNVLTEDIGLLIRDAIEGKAFHTYLKNESGELVESVYTECVESVDVSDANNSLVHLANGQRFLVRIIAR